MDIIWNITFCISLVFFICTWSFFVKYYFTTRNMCKHDEDKTKEKSIKSKHEG